MHASKMNTLQCIWAECDANINITNTLNIKMSVNTANKNNFIATERPLLRRETEERNSNGGGGNAEAKNPLPHTTF